MGTAPSKTISKIILTENSGRWEKQQNLSPSATQLHWQNLFYATVLKAYIFWRMTSNLTVINLSILALGTTPSPWSKSLFKCIWSSLLLRTKEDPTLFLKKQSTSSLQSCRKHSPQHQKQSVSQYTVFSGNGLYDRPQIIRFSFMWLHVITFKKKSVTSKMTTEVKFIELWTRT